MNTRRFVIVFLTVWFFSAVLVGAFCQSERMSVLMDDSELKGYGRLYIPSVGVNAALYTTVPHDGKAQRIVDAKDSAAYRVSHRGGCGFIGDHYNQGFAVISECEVGCHCYIKRADGISEYECVRVVRGRNDGHNLYTDDGEKLSDIHWADFACYTCVAGWRNVILVFFREIE